MTTAAPRTGGGLAALLFLAAFAFYWISTKPFVDLTLASVVDPSAGNSSLLNQLAAVVLFLALLAFGLGSEMRRFIAQPRALLVAIFIWFLLVSALSAHPDLALKKVMLAMMICLGTSVVLLLPRSERTFARLLGIGILLVLVLSYYGVVALPQLAIHQANEPLEPMNAGFWRGAFAHKNSAASAMVLAVFIGLFVMRAWSRLAGTMIVLAAAYFLFKTGGKTSMAVLPLILVVAYVFEKLPKLRTLIVFGSVGMFNLFAVGAALSEPLRNLVASFGVDPTFTNRTDIWRIALQAIADRPLTGYGFQSFWQTDELVYSGGNIESWAVAAANGHNGYIDMWLTTGLPGLVMTLVWLLVLPLRDVHAAERAGNDPALTRLFVRIWLFSILTACLESTFFEGGGAMWFTLLIAIFGLRMQARASLVTAPQASGSLAHA